MAENEGFLKTPASVNAHARARVQMWHVLPRSPDLNPVEQVWGWLRMRLRKMDLADLTVKRAPIARAALKARVRSLVRSQHAKRVTKNYMWGLRKTCLEVIKKRGAATRV